MQQLSGGFTLPGEAGYEGLTLRLADKWGADVIRDSDGTALSDEILNAGRGIYSTICIIRDHNDWAREHMDTLQQTFLMTQPRVAVEETLEITLMRDFFAEQFSLNDTPEGLACWQVFDRTANEEISREDWSYQKETGSVTLKNPVRWHKYTVNFLAYRIWEEISMYNHTTNNWDKEHLMQIDPRHPAVQEYLLDWMERWCQGHPDTTVVRFTSMFYNFVWIWGENERNRSLFTDWGSYDFTVSPLALRQFEEAYGYPVTAEDFINKGKFHANHIAPGRKKRDWMAFVHDFVITFGKKLIDIVHKHGKQAYVFYDDSWVGVEPYSPRFAEFGFDGIIKCVFSGFEARLCAGVTGAETHELRLHPYLFPVGLGGAPTFMEGGNPTLDAKRFWNSIRRALLRAPVDRIGLGGYLHLVEPYPDFCDYIEKVANEFRTIRQFHADGKPYVLPLKVGILTAWGKLRSWTCGGHYHEHPELDLINLLESLSGLPVEVEFLSFDEVRGGVPKGISVLVNAGFAGSAWSGGDAWRDDALVASLTRWVYEGGALLGVHEPSAVEGYDTFFRLSPVLGVDRDLGERLCHGRWLFGTEDIGVFVPDSTVSPLPGIYLTDGDAQVLSAVGDLPTCTSHPFGKGRGIYLSSYRHSIPNARMLLNLLLHAAGLSADQLYVTDNPYTECAYYPASRTLAVVNLTEVEQSAAVRTVDGVVRARIAPFDSYILQQG